MESYAGIFGALKNGTLVQDLAHFENEQLRPFLPLLMFSAFPNDASSEDDLDVLRSRLIDIQAGNQFLQYMKLDFATVGAKCQELWKSQAGGPRPSHFLQLSCLDKTLLICSHLISRLQKNATSSSAESFDPFDIEHCQEEVIWIVTLASLYMPDLFGLQKLASVLLTYSSGPKLLALAVLNQPDVYDSVLRGVAGMFSGSDEESFLAHQRIEAIRMLLQLDSAEAVALLSRTVAAEKNPAMVVDILCCSAVDDLYFIEFLIGQLITPGSSFGTHVVKGAHRHHMKKICDRLGRILIRANKTQSEQNERIVLLLALLSSYTSFKQTLTEGHEWLIFFTSQTTTKSSLLQTSLAALLASPSLLHSHATSLDERTEQSMVEFFRWIRDLASSNDDQYASLSQFMLLVAIHMNANRADELANLLSSALGFKVAETLRKISSVKALYLRHALTDRDIAEKAARIGVTKQLTAHTGGYLPAHCINHLLSSRAFSRYQAPVQNWIKAQLNECRAPVHSIMTGLLDNFADSCIPKTNESTFNQAIDEDYFWELFSGDPFDSSKLVLRVLAFYYLLLYAHKLENTAIPPALYGTKRAPVTYSQRLWALIPVRYLLIAIDSRHADFQHLRPTLLKVVGITMPHMLPTIGSVLDRTDIEASQSRLETSKPIPVEAVQSALRHYPTEPSRFANLLSRLESSPITEQYRHYETIVEAMTTTLDEKTPRPLSEKVTRIWRRLENLIPRKLYEMTMQQWLNTISAATSGLVDDNMLISEAPLVMFRVDERVLRSPPHFRCLMHMVSFYLEASNNANNIRLLKSHFQQPPPTKLEIDERVHLLKSFVGTQHLAVVQILLEICDGDPQERPELEEIRKIACDQIHQMFIADPTLCKLVHFHTYALRLIPVMVKGVPSAHVLIGFIGELLANPDLQRRIFAVVLMVELWEQYKIPQSFAGLDLVSDVLSALLCYNNDESAIALFVTVVPVLARLVRISPYHSDAVASILQKVRRISQSRLAVYGSVTAARASPEWRLKQSIDLAMKSARV